MSKLIIAFCIFFFSSLVLSAQADRITGFWLTEDKDSQIEIYRVSGNKYNGKIVWLEEPNEEDGTVKRDDENPERSLRTRPLLGLEILKNFSYDASNEEWAEGTIYDPKSGRTYDAFMRLDGNNNLKLKGFVLGMRFLGRESEWRRERSLRE